MMSIADAAIRERIADTRRAIRRVEKMQERAAAVAEIRGHIRATLLMLTRYEPHYGDLLAALEDEWSTF